MSDPTPAVKFGSKPGVEYTLEIVEDLPESTRLQRSPLEDQLARIKADEKTHGKWYKVAEYDDSHACATAANLARRKHGRSAAVEGWTIQSKRFNKEVQRDGKTETFPKTGLFVRFTPDAIVPGAAEAHYAEQKERHQVQTQRRADKKAADAKAEAKTENKDTAQKADQAKGQARKSA